MIICAHGWGFDASFWDPLQEALPEYELSCLDFGFRGHEDIPHFQDIEEPVVAIGHSLGALWLMGTSGYPIKAMIVINGFTRFTRSETIPNGVDERMLKRMIRQLLSKQDTVLQDFLYRCGLDDFPETATWDLDRLIWGLGGLEGWTGKYIGPLLALAGSRDQIATPEHQKDCFGSQVHFKQGGDHLLPLSDPNWVAQEIEGFLKEHA